MKFTHMYALRSGLSYCVIDEAVVFLDVPRDRYFALSRKMAKRFLTLAQAIEHDGAVPVGEAAAFVARDILVEGDGARPWAATFIPRPAREWRLADCDATRSKLRHKLLALACILATIVRLKTRSFEAAIEAGDPIGHDVPPMTLPPHVIAAFLTVCRLLPWRLDCLPAALSLRSYLRTFSISPHLMLAVTLNPFAAHCWIQVGDMLVGDTLERIQPFTPIRHVR